MSERTDSPQRRLPVGAEAQPHRGVHFRAWAPRSRRVAVLIGEREELWHARELALQSEAGGYWSGEAPDASVGMHYRYRLESGDFPDTASRF